MLSAASFTAAGMTVSAITGDDFLFLFSMVAAGLLAATVLFLRRLLPVRLGRILSLAALAAAAGAWHHSMDRRLPKDHIAVSPPTDEVALAGTIASFPEPTHNGGRVDVDVAGIETSEGILHPRSGRIRLVFEDDAWSAFYADPRSVPGAGLRCEIRLNRSTGYLNPGCYNPARQLDNKGIRLSGFIRYPEFFILLRSSHTVTGWLACRRADALHILDRIAGLDASGAGDSAAVSKALLLGSRGEISPETQIIFQESGLVHLLAISGLHVGIISGFFAVILKFLPGNLRSRNLILVIIVCLYSVLAGGNPSVVRAACLVCCHATARICHRPASMINTLSLSMIMLLIVRPGWIGDPGFQLTYAATYGIAVIYPGLRLRLQWLPGKWLGDSIAVALAAQCATAPFAAIWFNRIGILGAVSGLPLIPLTSLVLVTGLAAVSFQWIPLFGDISIRLHAILLSGMIKGARFESTLPWITLPVLTPHILLAAFLLAGTGLLCYRDGAGYRSAVACIMTPLCLATLPIQPDHPHLNLDIRLLDVGNGDCSLVQLPDGKILMIDAGGILDSDYDIGTQVVVRTARTLGIGKVDTVVITHPHPDHQLGMKAVISNLNPSELWVLNEYSDQEVFRSILDSARDRGVRLSSLDNRWIHRDFRMNENNCSIVLGIRYGNFRILLPGDAEKELEAGLMDYGPSLRSTVLKVGHHGSGSSSSASFIRAVQPLIAMIPCGRQNQFNHPHASALRNLKKWAPGVRILRSDLHGMIHIETDGRLVRASWMSPEPQR